MNIFKDEDGVWQLTCELADRNDVRKCALAVDATKSNSFMVLESPNSTKLTLTADFAASYNTLQYHIVKAIPTGDRFWDGGWRLFAVLHCISNTNLHCLFYLTIFWPSNPASSPFVDHTQTQCVVIKNMTISDITLHNGFGFWAMTSKYRPLAFPKVWWHPCVSGNRTIRWVNNR